MRIFLKKFFSYSKPRYTSSQSSLSIQINAEYYEKLRKIAETKGFHNLNSATIETLVAEAIDFYTEHTFNDTVHTPELASKQKSIPSLDYPWCAADEYLIWKSTETPIRHKHKR